MALLQVNYWRILISAVEDFFEDDVVTLAASVSFFTALSLAPLLVIVVSATDVIGPELQQRLVNEIGRLIGPRASEGVMMVIRNVSEAKFSAELSAIIGVLVLFFSSTAVFAQLQKALNRIWGVKGPDEIQLKAEVWDWLKKRLLSLGLIFGIGFLLLVSLAVSALLNFWLPDSSQVWPLLNTSVSLLVYVVLFGAMFRILPDTDIAWKDVWLGSLLTALLFSLGKWAIGKYLGFSSAAAAYGAAGSFMILLLWVYYATVVVFLGAEFTHAHERALRKYRRKKREAKDKAEAEQAASQSRPDSGE